MFASPLNHQATSTSLVPYTIRKYLTMRGLAMAMFIAFALLAGITDKETETNWASPWKNTNGGRPIRHLGKASSEYADQQGRMGTPDSPTAPLIRSSNQEAICSKSASSESRKQSPAYYHHL
jgi:hypothetical protein